VQQRIIAQVMPVASVPGLLLGPAFTSCAILILVAAVTLALSLALVEMKTSRLREAVRDALRARSPAGAHADLASEGPKLEAQSEGAKIRARRSKLPKRKFFFLGDADSADDEELYSLPDSAWLEPDLASNAPEPFDLPDALWVEVEMPDGVWPEPGLASDAHESPGAQWAGPGPSAGA